MGDLAQVKALLDKGADIAAKDSKGRNCFSFASKGYGSLIALL